MYKPKFNKVLIEIDDKDAKWGKGSEDNIGGEVYREGRIVDIATELFPSGDYRDLNGMQWANIVANLNGLAGKTVMWHEGHEAGTVFEHPSTEIVDGEKVTTTKKYALIYWFDIAGVKSSDE